MRPNADLDIGATDRLFDLEVEDVDVAVRYMRAEAAPPESTLLIDELLFPLVSQPLAPFADKAWHLSAHID
jgi:DNA-binding transcriptional LysR family regulator